MVAESHADASSKCLLLVDKYAKAMIVTVVKNGAVRNAPTPGKKKDAQEELRDAKIRQRAAKAALEKACGPEAGVGIGPQGPPGVQGPAGGQGPIGRAGDLGPQGVSGVIGLPGATGMPGLRGVTGTTGPIGPTGATGPQGAKGAMGAGVTSALGAAPGNFLPAVAEGDHTIELKAAISSLADAPSVSQNFMTVELRP